MNAFIAISYIFAMGGLACLVVVIVREFFRKPFTPQNQPDKLSNGESESASSDDRSKQARQKLNKACRPSLVFRWAHFSLGRRLLDKDEQQD